MIATAPLRPSRFFWLAARRGGDIRRIGPVGATTWDCQPTSSCWRWHYATRPPHAAEVVANSFITEACLITGDNQHAAAIAQTVGIPAENVFAEVRPERKAEIVQQPSGAANARSSATASTTPALSSGPRHRRRPRQLPRAKPRLSSSDIDAVPEALALAQATLRTIANLCELSTLLPLLAALGNQRAPPRWACPN